MKLSRRGSHGGEEERWLLTYSDMITLLLALFIVLFALSTLSKAKFAEFRTGVRAEFASRPQSLSPAGAGLLHQEALATRLLLPRRLANPISPASPSALAPTATAITAAPSAAAQPDLSQLRKLEQAVESALASKGLLGDVIVTLTPKDLSIELLADRVFFATNSNALAPVGAEIVDTVGSVLRPQPNAMSVRGYTDNEPVTGGPWYSNFMLSAARATTVVLRLMSTDGITAGRLMVEGFGPTHPVASNSTPAGQAENRRVDIVILPEGTT